MEQRKKAIQDIEQRIVRLESDRDGLYRTLGELAWRSGALRTLSPDVFGGLEALERAESARAALAVEYDRREADILALDEEAVSVSSRFRELEGKETEALRSFALSILDNASRFDLPSLEGEISLLRASVQSLADKETRLEALSPVAGGLDADRSGPDGNSAGGNFFAVIGRSLGRSGKRTLIRASLPALRKRLDAQALVLGRAAFRIEDTTWAAIPACNRAYNAALELRQEKDSLDARLAEIKGLRSESLAWLGSTGGHSSWQAARRALESARRADEAAREALWLEAGTLASAGKAGKGDKKIADAFDAGTPDAQRHTQLVAALGECLLSIAEAREAISLLEAEIARDSLLEEKKLVLAAIRDHEERIARSTAEIATRRHRVAELDDEVAALEKKIAKGKQADV